jgi:hypothetical protein
LKQLVEYQGGAYQPWGGDGFEKCAEFTNHEFERVFYKNNIAAGATIFNVYMVGLDPEMNGIRQRTDSG